MSVLATIRRKNWVGIALGLWLAMGAADAPGQAPTEGTREAMQSIFANIEQLVTIVVSEQPSDPSQAWQSLRLISEMASLLSAHSDETDPLTGFLSASLERMSSTISLMQEFYPDGRWRKQLFRMTDVCVACHTRRPSQDALVGKQFVQREHIRTLPLAMRAKLETAARRFRRGAASWNELARRIVAGPPLLKVAARKSPREAELVEAVTELLVLTERVLLDDALTRELFHWMGDQAEMPEPLRKSVEYWEQALSDKVRAQSPGALLATADRLDGESFKGGLVHRVMASASLYRSLDQPETSKQARAQDYYSLGTIEHNLNQGHWLPRSELLLEVAIRTAPGSPAAERAYSLLEKIVAQSYQGAPLPADVREHLDMLKGLEK